MLASMTEQQSNQSRLPLAAARPSAGDKGITEGGQLLRRMMTANFHDFGAGKLIAMFIWMSGVTLKPLPGNSIARGGFGKLSPQVIVFHRLPINREPVVG